MPDAATFKAIGFTFLGIGVACVIALAAWWDLNDMQRRDTKERLKTRMVRLFVSLFKGTRWAIRGAPKLVRWLKVNWDEVWNAIKFFTLAGGLLGFIIWLFVTVVGKFK
ncbi:hypothetical protein DRO66_02565 [Candidatus Bathyarchaeota archaeon]|nr:MAG: hypothetical protein DRO66_02565 [Candidatus Bathyarchaeota archaeon]